MELVKVTIGNCELYHADCMAVLPLLQRVSHVITDPPYEAEAHTKARRMLGRSERDGSRVFGSFPIDFEQMSDGLRHGVGEEIERVCAGWSLLFCQIEGVEKWREALPGAKYMRTCIWVKPDGAPQFTGDRPGMGYEPIVTFWHGKGRSRWNGGGRHGVFTFPKSDVGYGHGGLQNEHPTKKPIRLMNELVQLFTDAGDTVLDPFMGSGSTGVACVRQGRRFIGIEQNAAYFAAACRRIQEAVAQPDLFIDYQPKVA